ncbi:hypothetical protein HanLR1_Chr06g0220551 [Helianthus annuus]|nr:hypothetical protein HanHA89_Chr06g0236601 [Helianthus annuus]KAJ0738638.1 hypothetical protein HanLR1_Chr06g0220551 [Helianthus annuus]
MGNTKRFGLLMKQNTTHTHTLSVCVCVCVSNTAGESKGKPLFIKDHQIKGVFGSQIRA